MVQFNTMISVAGLETFRQNKEYQELLDLIPRGESRKDIRILPIAVDASRGLIQRSFSIPEISRIHFDLMDISSGCLTDSKYLALVDQDYVSAVSHRRDLSRYFWSIAPLISSAVHDCQIDSLSLLNRADEFTPESSWQKKLITIERSNKIVKFGHRVDLNNVFTALNSLSKDSQVSNDAFKALSTWSLETVLIQSPLEIPDYFSAITRESFTKDKSKIIGRTSLRLLQEKTRDYLLELNQPKNNSQDIVLISNQLSRITESWVK